ncbi:MAG: hypothetical protein M1288_00735 [Actinobacteria bacterium]|jgi:hypothetical protein|nr:hypothetical protein [Actinomycetota bacterium]
MNGSKRDVFVAEHAGVRTGVLIIAAGWGVIAIAYVILALQAASHTPNRPIWSVLYETAWAVGWVLAAIGAVTVGLNFKTLSNFKRVDEAD